MKESSKRRLLAVIVLTTIFLTGLFLLEAEAELQADTQDNKELTGEELVMLEQNTILSSVAPTLDIDPEPEFVPEGVIRTITAYSSTVDQTNSEPFITASGEWVKDGIVAANFLPFGTQIRIPTVFGDKVFTVTDRMHPRNDGKIDIWFPSREEAIKFGVKKTEIEILRKTR
jgi:3D (Asp-Asp-Asp) domain-containing protein